MLVFNWLIKITNTKSFNLGRQTVKAKFLKIEIHQPFCVEVLKMKKYSCDPLGGVALNRSCSTSGTFRVNCVKQSGDISSQHKTRQMRSREFQTVGTIPKSHTKFVEIDTLTRIYMTSHFPGLVRTFQ